MPNQMERAASKAMGKVKATKARLKGLKGIFRQLSEEHGEVSALLRRVKMTSDPKVRAELFPKIKKELLSHERAEVSELYPLLMQNPQTRGIAEDHDREAREMEALLESLEQQDYASEGWKRDFIQLADMVEHHARDEENDWFPKAQDVLGHERAESLAGRYLTTKKSLMQQL